AICFIELGTSISEPGGDFAYTVFVGWEAIAFGFMWVSVFVTYPASAAVQAQTFGQYIVNGVAPLIALESGWHEFTERVVGYTLLVILTTLNFYSIDRFAAPFQVAVTSAKMLAMGTIIFTGFYYLFFEGWTANLANPMAGSVWAPGKLALAFYGGLWSYAGWDILNYGTPEIEKPNRQDFAQKTLGNFSYAIPFMVALLLIGTLNSNIFCGSRYVTSTYFHRSIDNRLIAQVHVRGCS
ncbi:unnamed protein product, partial [Nippostrongylus brasiliensis]|uniref:Solute carrier family 7 member 13 (inferred by orthology to a human protein) n=1 Tax=Nippostrongylus brasiliensis TaxID=27835 RepID=A0A0N4YIR9_NIPBR